MRYHVFSLVLILGWPFVAMGFEIEESRVFGSGGGEVLKVISTADADVFAPIIEAFLEQRPDLKVEYVVVSSTQLMQAVHEESAAFDVAVSSAMDLQTKIANDGLARSYVSNATAQLPDWAKWRDQVFAFTQEPATIVLSRAAFEGLEMPRTRQQLITVLRDNPERFEGRVGTYDLRVSGLGYLFATQDARASETYWRLAEVMGNLGVRLYCCSSRMIDDVAGGEIAVAYNVLGSYALARGDIQDRIEIIQPRDFTTVMLRTALIPANSARADLGGQFIDHLVRARWIDAEQGDLPFPRIALGALEPQSKDAAFRPIRLGPGLLVYLDRLKRARFLREWEAAILQR